jgi:protein gp37
MGDKTAIEWADASWNPTAGCALVSPGCTNCYAMRLAHRLGHIEDAVGGKYGELTHAVNGRAVWTGELRFDEYVLSQPLRWRRPRRIFVNSMSDLFHEAVREDWLDRIFAIMASAPQHQFLVLTKRPEHMRDWIKAQAARNGDWPLANVWLGVSVEDQARADERIPALLDTPAARHWISAEPLLDRVLLRTEWLHNRRSAAPGLRGDHYTEALDWIVCGGESGPGARPMLRSWATSLRDQSAAAGVPFFFKQWGEWIDADEWMNSFELGISRGGELWRPARPLNYVDAQWLAEALGRGGNRYEHHSDGTTVIRVGRRAAGRLLDGREHNEFPGARQ